MPAIWAMSAGKIALNGSVAGMASSYRRPARTGGHARVCVMSAEKCSADCLSLINERPTSAYQWLSGL